MVNRWTDDPFIVAGERHMAGDPMNRIHWLARKDGKTYIKNEHTSQKQPVRAFKYAILFL